MAPPAHPWFCYILYTFPHICILAYHLRGADLGRGIVVTKPSRSGRFRIRGFYENSVRRVVLRRRYGISTMRRLLLRWTSRGIRHTLSRTASNARARGACKLYVATLAAGTDTRLTSPSLPLGPTPLHPNSDRGTSERTRRTTRVRLPTQSVQYCHLLFTNATWLARACAC
jgi:hypothetical protein